MAQFSHSDFSNNRTLMPHPLTISLLLFLHLCVPMPVEPHCHFPVSSLCCIWLQSPPFCWNSLPTNGCLFATSKADTHLVLITHSVWQHCQWSSLFHQSPGHQPLLLFHMPLEPHLSLLWVLLFCMSREVIFSNLPVMSAGTHPERPVYHVSSWFPKFYLQDCLCPELYLDPHAFLATFWTSYTQYIKNLIY